MILFLYIPFISVQRRLKKWVSITILEALFAKVRTPSKKLSPLLRWGQWHPNSATDIDLKYVITGSYQSTLSPNVWLLKAMRSCWGRLSTNFFQRYQMRCLFVQQKNTIVLGSQKAWNTMYLGKKFLPSILNVIVYSGPLHQMAEYSRYKRSHFSCKLRNSNKEINNNHSVVTEKMPQDSTMHSASSNYSESFKNWVQETN